MLCLVDKVVCKKKRACVLGSEHASTHPSVIVLPTMETQKSEGRETALSKMGSGCSVSQNTSSLKHVSVFRKMMIGVGASLFPSMHVGSTCFLHIAQGKGPP